jgi:hypothetical protein
MTAQLADAGEGGRSRRAIERRAYINILESVGRRARV